MGVAHMYTCMYVTACLPMLVCAGGCVCKHVCVHTYVCGEKQSQLLAVLYFAHPQLPHQQPPGLGNESGDRTKPSDVRPVLVGWHLPSAGEQLTGGEVEPQKTMGHPGVIQGKPCLTGPHAAAGILID